MNHQETTPPDCYYFKFGLLVTGKTEETHLNNLFKPLMELGNCSFEVIRKIEQLGVITSERKTLKMVGRGQIIPTKDEERIGYPAREYLQNPCNYVILVDDLEYDRVEYAEQIFARY
jgi:hypothetical protein